MTSTHGRSTLLVLVEAKAVGGIACRSGCLAWLGHAVAACGLLVSLRSAPSTSPVSSIVPWLEQDRVGLASIGPLTIKGIQRAAIRTNLPGCLRCWQDTRLALTQIRIHGVALSCLPGR